jgi:hypothetical protein
VCFAISTFTLHPWCPKRLPHPPPHHPHLITTLQGFWVVWMRSEFRGPINGCGWATRKSRLVHCGIHLCHGQSSQSRSAIDERLHACQLLVDHQGDQGRVGERENRLCAAFRLRLLIESNASDRLIRLSQAPSAEVSAACCMVRTTSPPLSAPRRKSITLGSRRRKNSPAHPVWLTDP